MGYRLLVRKLRGTLLARYNRKIASMRPFTLHSRYPRQQACPYSPGKFTFSPIGVTHDSLCDVDRGRIHGGSFTSGSASAPGLVGSKLATEGNIITIVLQYRLGVLGYLPPTSAPSASDPNIGVGDIVLALKMIRNNVRNFGGDGGRVVLGGQSSGAHMIRGSLLFPHITIASLT